MKYQAKVKREYRAGSFDFPLGKFSGVCLLGGGNLEELLVVPMQHS